MQPSRPRRPSCRPLRSSPAAWIIAAALLAPQPLRAGPACFPYVPIPGWDPTNIGPFPNGSSESQPAPQVFKLCSESAGLGVADDAVRYLHRDTTGDFSITVRVDDFNAPGMGGLMVREDAARPDSAFLAIYVQLQTTGSFVINSSFRDDTAAAATLHVGPSISTGLPAYLRIVRSGSDLSSFYSPNGINYVKHVQVGGPSTDLGNGPLTTGLVQSSQNAAATSTTWFWNPLIVLQGRVGGPIDLGDVVAGGDGSGNAPAANTGIDPRNGRFVTTYLDGHISETDAVADGLNPSPTASPFIDSVLFITERSMPGGVGLLHDPITRSGVMYDFAAGDGVPPPGSAWNYVVADRNGGASAAPVVVGGIVFSTAVGIHSSTGITFDLDALRAAHGDASVGCFETFWGVDDCGGADVQLYAILSSDVAGSGLIDSRTARFTQGQGAFMDPLEIPPAARYLTLATGSRGIDACDHGTFARAWISGSPCLAPSSVALLAASPESVTTAGGTLLTLTGEGFTAGLRALVGGQPLTGVTVLDTGHLQGRTPTLPAGRHTVALTTASGGVLASLPDAIEAVETVSGPAITAVEPSDVNRDGTTAISIHGTAFAAGMQVRIGGQPLASQIVASPTLITGMAPALPEAESDGPRDVTIASPLGNAVLPGGVAYFTAEQVTIARVTPAFVSTEGGTAVEISGSFFAPGMTARLGGLPLGAQVIVSPMQIRGESPPLPAGFHAAQITGAGGEELARLDRAVEAGAALAIAAVEPRRVQRSGTTAISIHGSGFGAATAVSIGSHALANQRVVSPSLITGTAPALTAAELDGPRDVTARDARSTVTFTGGVRYVGSAVKTLSFTERFAPEDLTLTPTTMYNGVPAVQVSLRGGELSAHVGEPALPVIHRQLVLPRGALVVDAEASPGPKSLFSGHSMVAWTQRAQPSQAAGAAPPLPQYEQGPDGSIYFSPSAPVPLDPAVLALPVWPRDGVVIESVESIDEFELVTLRISPLEWKPGAGTIELASSLQISLFHEGGVAPDGAATPDYRQAMTREELRGSVANPDAVPPQSTAFQPPRELDAWYLIITDDRRWNEDMTLDNGSMNGRLVPAFERLAKWKRQKGLKADVVTVSEIVSGRYGDFRTGARDLQEVIRKFLLHARDEFHTYWVLLGGDHSIVPSRRAVAYRGPVPAGSAALPSFGELYYDANTALVRIHSSGFMEEAERATIRQASSGVVFHKTTAPSAQNPGWTFVDETYTQESMVPTEYLVVGGVAITYFDQIPLPPVDLYGADLNSHIPTDLYYANVRDDWDADGNGIHGEMLEATSIDGAGFSPDFPLGRMPVHHGSEAEIWVDKVIAYEKYQGVPEDFAEKLLLASTNWWGGPGAWQGSSDPPPKQAYYHAANATEAHVHLAGPPGPQHVLQFRLVAYNSPSDFWIVPYHHNPGPGQLAYHYAISDSYSQASVLINLPWPTEWLRVVGPANKLQPKLFFFDLQLPDQAVVEKETVKQLFEANFPGLDLRQRHYADALDTPGWPASDLFVLDLGGAALNAALSQGANIVSLSGHGSHEGCCGLRSWDVVQLTNGLQGGIVYADSCLTGRFFDGAAMTRTLPRLSKGGVAAWAGNTSVGWIGTGHPFEMRFWDRLQTDRHAGRLLNTKSSLTTTVLEKWTNYSFHLFGDPEMPIWIGPPGRLKSKHLFCVKRDELFHITVTDTNDQPIDRAVVTVTTEDGFFDWRWTAFDGTAFFDPANWPAGPTFRITVTARDFVPLEDIASLGGNSCTDNAFYRGDSNGDGRDDLSDAIFTLAYLFQGGPAPRCLAAADTNDSGAVDISDPVYLLGFLYLGGEPPPGFDPAAAPQPDPTPDGLGCAVGTPDPAGRG